MKNLSIIALILLCLACGSGKPDMVKTAVTGFPTPLYDGMVSATTGSATKTLPPHTLVYLQNLELNVNNKPMVKVYVDDSTEGYVPREWLLQDGKLGVVECSNTNPIIIYDDEEGQVVSGKTMVELQLVGFKNVSEGVSQIIYANDRDGSRPFIGYIKAPVISDSLSMAFSYLFFDAFQKQRFENNTRPMEALLDDERFNSLPLRARTLGPVTTPATASSGNHTTLKWIDQDGNALLTDSIPGVAVLHYIWEDNSESDGNHFGDNLEQGTPECDKEHSAMGYKLLFTANRKMDITLVCTLPSIADQEGPRVQEIKGAEPGKTYELLVMPKVYGVVCDEETVFTVQAPYFAYMGEARVHASCGD
jgi:hypothetical protein